MEWRIEWTTLPCFVPMNKKLASLLFTGTFWLSWRPWVYGYCRVSVQMSETLFETKPFISRYVGKRVSLMTMKEISFLSHFHIGRGYIVSRWETCVVHLRFVSLLRSFPLLESMPLFLSRPKAVKVSSSPSTFFFSFFPFKLKLENKK